MTDTLMVEQLRGFIPLPPACWRGVCAGARSRLVCTGDRRMCTTGRRENPAPPGTLPGRGLGVQMSVKRYPSGNPAKRSVINSHLYDAMVDVLPSGAFSPILRASPSVDLWASPSSTLVHGFVLRQASDLLQNHATFDFVAMTYHRGIRVMFG